MNGLNAIQVEQLQQIGEYLQQVRESQSVSLEKVAKDTFIPLRLLSALETGEVGRLPEPVYVKGFIRRYADALGLDGAEIAAAFDVDAPAEPAPATPAPATHAAIAVAEARAVEHQAAAREPNERPAWLKLPGLAYLLAGMAAVAGVGAIAFNWSQSSLRTTRPDPAAETTPVTQAPTSPVPQPPVAQSPESGEVESAPKKSPAPTAIAPPNTPQPTPNAPVQVEVSLVDRSWMQVVADGNIVFEETLAKGAQRTWTAQNTLEIRAGNAGAVVASYNQGQAKPLGRLGEVVDASFSRDRQPASADRSIQ